MAPAVFDVFREEGIRSDSFFYHIGDGFYFRKIHDRPGTTHFKCVRFEQGCEGRAVLDDHKGFVQTSVHNHEGDDLHYAEEMYVKRNILARCRDQEYVDFTQIVDEEIQGACPEVRARTSTARMKMRMRNALVSSRC